jgi:monofunctional biosynthetic peptidoglycan transglycosylase
VRPPSRTVLVELRAPQRAQGLKPWPETTLTFRSCAGWLLVALAGVALQLFFIGRIALMAVVDPSSTTFERSEAWRMCGKRAAALAPAVGALRADLRPPQARRDRLGRRRLHQPRRRGMGSHRESLGEEHAGRGTGRQTRRQAPPGNPPRCAAPKIVGGSTITQQLAKNLLLSGERTLLRKGQEFVLTLALELLLSKQRILEIYLNNVEWGEGVFGAEAAAQHYYRKPASKLSAYEAARLAVMLPRPKYFEKVPNSGYLSSRAGTIVARMGDAVLP